jgi:F5/8 type C domain
VEGFAVMRAYEEALSPWRPAAPGTWTATATSRPGEARAAVDGRRETAWRSGAPQRSGMALELEARVPVRLGGLRLVPAMSGEGPRGLTVELSSDGRTWEPVATRGRGEVAWTGWHVVRLGREGYVVRFAPRDVRGVRVVLTADAPAEWSVAEVEWYE